MAAPNFGLLPKLVRVEQRLRIAGESVRGSEKRGIFQPCATRGAGSVSCRTLTLTSCSISFRLVTLVVSASTTGAMWILAFSC